MGPLDAPPGEGQVPHQDAIRPPSVQTYRLTQEVSKRVEDGATVYTDALASYRPLNLYYEHKVIDHAEAYVGRANPHERPGELLEPAEAEEVAPTSASSRSTFPLPGRTGVPVQRTGRRRTRTASPSPSARRGTSDPVQGTHR